MDAYARLRDLPLCVESMRLERLELAVSDVFRRIATVVRLSGQGHEGVGEDVTYEAPDQERFQARGGDLDVAGEHTVGGFSARLDELALFDEPPLSPASLDYRRWAFESAAVDLALRQAGRSLAEVLGLECRPVRFVASLGLGRPSSVEPVLERLELLPSMRFKLDAAADWDGALVGALAETGAIDVVDLKGFYRGTPVDLDGDPVLYRRIAEGLPEACIEDPWLDDATRPALAAFQDRIAWDAPIHSVADLEALAEPPRWINIKPSRFGTWERLLDAYAWCAERGVRTYGGGQFELGPGRGQIQLLASLFHADAPNDTSPTAYHGAPSSDLPQSPLAPRPDAIGFRWQE